MELSNLKKGVKTLYIAAILHVAVLLLTFIVSILAIFAGDDEENPLLVLVGLLGIAFLVAGILVIIFDLVGSNKASKGEALFKKAFLCMLFDLLFSIVAAFTNGMAQKILSLVAAVLEFGFGFFVVLGMIKLAKDRKQEEIAENGQKTKMLYCIAYAVSLVGSAIYTFTEGTIASVFSTISSLGMLVAFIFYFLFLKKSMNVVDIPLKQEEDTENPVEVEAE